MSKINMTNSRATAKGYTIPVEARCDGELLLLLIRDDADRTGMVTAWDTAAQCYVELNGLFWEFEEELVT